MIDNKRVIAIVPARGGSKGVPRKNIKLLAGKPLIAYTIDAARRSKYLDRIIVSTDDKEIAEITTECGAEVIMRPKELATDSAPTLPVLQHVVKHLERKENYLTDIIVVLQPTSPFRKEIHINEAIKKLIDTKADSVVGVKRLKTSNKWLLGINNNKLFFLYKNDFKKIRRQDLELCYEINGAIYIHTRETVMRASRYAMGKDSRPLVMDEKSSMDINTLSDFELAESILKNESKNIKKIKIGDKLVGENQPVFIIAEAGVNHNGSIELAKKLVDAAAEAGADAVKFQAFKVENLVTKEVGMVSYQEKNTGKKESQLEMLKKLELSNKSFEELKKYCDKKRIMFLSTPHTEDTIDFLDKHIPSFKIASGDLTNIPFLERIAEKKKPIILSTGMSTMQEVKEAVQAIKNKGNKNLILLHCTTSYPCSEEKINLRAMKTIQKETDCLVGYSDHTLGVLAPLMAISMGAVVIEKHFTLDKNLPGPDHKASLEPEELKIMVKSIRQAEKAFGNGIKKPTQEEEKIKKVARKSIIANQDIPKETTITGNMLVIKRPGTGLPPRCIALVIGKKARKDIKKDEVIARGMIRA